MGRFGRKRAKKQADPAARVRILVQGGWQSGISTIVRWLEHGGQKEAGKPRLEENDNIKYGRMMRGMDDETTYKGFNVYHRHPGFGRCIERPIIQDFYPAAAALVYVIDCKTCKDTDGLKWVTTELNHLRREPDLDGAVIVVVANKQDLSGARSAEEIEEFINRGEREKIKVFPTVATKGEGVTACFDWVIDEIEKLNAPAQNDAVMEPWQETEKDVAKDGEAGFKILKAAGKKLMSKIMNVSSPVA